MRIIILAGGSGSRLWPLSRDRHPKQFIKFRDKETSLFQDTLIRSLKLVSIDDIFIVAHQNYYYLIINEIKELGLNAIEKNIIIEPEAKNTLPAIYAGVHEILKQGDDVVVVFPSDHLITRSDKFVDIIQNSIFLSRDYLITFGIKADYPNTGFGYISPGKKLEKGYLVRAFNEKPNIKLAEEYIKKGYFWNAGIFMFDANNFKNEVRLLAPEIYNAFETTYTVKDAFSKIKSKVSIDYGIMEKSNKVAVVPADVGWNDLGSFDSLNTIFESDVKSNVSNVNDILIDSNNNLIISDKEKLITLLGIDDLIIIDNQDALLICKKNESQRVKDIYNILKERNDERAVSNLYDFYPWGYSKLIEEIKNFLVIRTLLLHERKRTDSQTDDHHSKYIIALNGNVRLHLDDSHHYLHAQESFLVKAGQCLEIENSNQFDLEILEIQIIFSKN